jgi:NADH-quinone oxidoreductase subunit M
MMDKLLSLITFLPLLGALLLMAFPRGRAPGARGFALFVSGATFVLSLVLWQRFDGTSAALQFVERVPWIESIGAQYLLGVDGISLFLVVLTTFLTPIVIVSSYSAVEDKVREYLFCMLVLETAMIGALVSQDMLLFYVFWEAMLIPMYFLIGVFGGKNKIEATIKFFLYTMAGSVLMLVAILWLYFKGVPPGTARTFELAVLTKHTIGIEAQRWMFLAFAFSFAIKVPMFPVHTWLPLAHVEAPTGGSVILAGVLLKMGTYGFLRFAMPLFPVAAREFLPWIGVLAVIGIVYGALVSMVQKDIKKVVAYSSVSHLGFVMLGIAAMSTSGVTGAVYQMLNHGVSTGALFLLVGVIYERRHTREIEAFGGLAKVAPIYAAVFLIITLSSIGLPGLNGFVGEFMILAGTFSSKALGSQMPFYGWGPPLVVAGALGVIFAAVYLLWPYQRMFFGPIRHQENLHVSDLNSREALMFAPLVVLVVVMGVMPRLFLSSIEPSVQKVVSDFNSAQLAAPPTSPRGSDMLRRQPALLERLQRMNQDNQPILVPTPAQPKTQETPQ